VDIDPCGICCGIIIIILIIAWAWSASPILTILFFVILGIIIVVIIVRIRTRRRREAAVERPTVTPRKKPPKVEKVTFKTVSTVEAGRCVFCGGNFPEELDICPECGEERVKCSVCQLNIAFGDDVVRCPHCGVLSHRDHLLEWIKIRGFCPNCREKLSKVEIKKLALW
jgi:hypothetical protein